MKRNKKNKIIEATIECINEYGIENTTIRMIASAADVNSAAISYYFESKDNLIDLALSTTLKNAFDWNDFNHLEGLPVKEKLFHIFNHLMDGGMIYKGIARAHYYETFLNEDYSTAAVNKLNEFLEIIFISIRDELTERNDEHIRMALIQLTYATLVSSSFMPDFFSLFLGRDLSDREYRIKYLKSMIESLFS